MLKVWCCAKRQSQAIPAAHDCAWVGQVETTSCPVTLVETQTKKSESVRLELDYLAIVACYWPTVTFRSLWFDQYSTIAIAYRTASLAQRSSGAVVHSLCGRCIEINIEYRTRNHEFRMKSQDTSLFDIPCSAFNIQRSPKLSAIWPFPAKGPTLPRARVNLFDDLIANFAPIVKGCTFVTKTSLQQILLRKIFRLGWLFRIQSEGCW